MTAEAIAKASQPRGHTLSGEVPERLVIALAAQVHHRHLEAIAEFADLIKERATEN